jgi:hypothetical protein
VDVAQLIVSSALMRRKAVDCISARTIRGPCRMLRRPSCLDVSEHLFSLAIFLATDLGRGQHIGDGLALAGASAPSMVSKYCQFAGHREVVAEVDWREDIRARGGMKVEIVTLPNNANSRVCHQRYRRNVPILM